MKKPGVLSQDCTREISTEFQVRPGMTSLTVCVRVAASKSEGCSTSRLATQRGRFQMQPTGPGKRGREEAQKMFLFSSPLQSEEDDDQGGSA